jgi:glyceraldehyde 3-phosphate dehydrogenase
MKGIIEYVDEPIVSPDIVGNSHSSIFGSLNTRVIGGNMIKCTMWYDNEWRYSCRTADLVEKVATM